jgi:hypothetical protein
MGGGSVGYAGAAEGVVGCLTEVRLEVRCA